MSQPAKPVVDNPTELKFSVLNLKTGEHIKNLLGRVVITNGQRSFKFTNISIPSGDFSVKYLFPDTGTYQVLTRIDNIPLKSNNENGYTSILSSFQIFVPIQAGNNNNMLVIIVSIAIAVVVFFMSLRFMLNKRKKKKENVV